MVEAPGVTPGQPAAVAWGRLEAREACAAIRAAPTLFLMSRREGSTQMPGPTIPNQAPSVPAAHLHSRGRPAFAITAALVGVLAADIACSVASAQTVEFIPGQARMGGLSADGNTASVTTATPDLRGQLGIWRRGQGVYNAGSEPGFPSDVVTFGLSADGQVAIGFQYEAAGIPAFRWSASTGHQQIPYPSGGTWIQANPDAINGDGTLIAGRAVGNSQTPDVCWTWSPTTGTQILPGFTTVLGMSRDGSTIFGVDSASLGVVRRNGVYSRLPAIGTTTATAGFASNTTGTVVVGSALDVMRGYAAVWPLGMPGYLLPSPAEVVSWRATQVTDDLHVVLGTGSSPGSPNSAAIWTQARGSELLSTYLAANGVTLDGYWLQKAQMSDDARTFLIESKELSTNTFRTMVVTIPAPGAVVLLAVPLLGARRRRLRTLPNTKLPHCSMKAEGTAG